MRLERPPRGAFSDMSVASRRGYARGLSVLSVGPRACPDRPGPRLPQQGAPANIGAIFRMRRTGANGPGAGSPATSRGLPCVPACHHRGAQEGRRVEQEQLTA